MLLLLASYHDDIDAVGTTEKIFYENELLRIKINQKSWFFIFKTSHSHPSYLVLHLHRWNISNQLYDNELLIIIHMEIIDHKFLSYIFIH